MGALQDTYGLMVDSTRRRRDNRDSTIVALSSSGEMRGKSPKGQGKGKATRARVKRAKDGGGAGRR